MLVSFLALRRGLGNGRRLDSPQAACDNPQISDPPSYDATYATTLLWAGPTPGPLFCWLS